MVLNSSYSSSITCEYFLKVSSEIVISWLCVGVLACGVLQSFWSVNLFLDNSNSKPVALNPDSTLELSGSFLKILMSGTQHRHQTRLIKSQFQGWSLGINKSSLSDTNVSKLSWILMLSLFVCLLCYSLP